MSWSLKNRVFGSDEWIKEKCDELSESAAFSQKFRYFTDQNGPKCGPHEIEF